MKNTVEELEAEIFEDINKLLIKLKTNADADRSKKLPSVRDVLELLVTNTELRNDPGYILDQYYNSSC